MELQQAITLKTPCERVEEILIELINLHHKTPESFDLTQTIKNYYSVRIADALETLIRHASAAKKKRGDYFAWWGNNEATIKAYPETQILDRAATMLEALVRTCQVKEDVSYNEEGKEKIFVLINTFIQASEAAIRNTDPKLAKCIGVMLMALIVFALLMSIGYGIGLIPAVAAWVAFAELFYFAKAASIALFACSVGAGLAAGGASAYVFFKVERGKLVDLVDEVKAAVDADQSLFKISPK